LGYILGDFFTSASGHPVTLTIETIEFGNPRTPIFLQWKLLFAQTCVKMENPPNLATASKNTFCLKDIQE
jgi:hypothetical protein